LGQAKPWVILQWFRCDWRLVYGKQAQKRLINISHEPDSSTGTQWSRVGATIWCLLRNQYFKWSTSHNVAQNHFLVAKPGQKCRICVPMVFAVVIAALVTVVSSWVIWQIYQVYLQSLQLSPIPGPPAAPGWLNAVLGNLSDLSDNQYHRTTTRWSEKYGGVCRLRFLNKHVSCIYILRACPCLQSLLQSIRHCSCLLPAGYSHCRPSNSLRDVEGQVYGQEHKRICDNECSKSQMFVQIVLLKIDTTTCDLGSMQLFDDKGHSGLLTSQMTPHWRAVRKAVASALSPQTLRCDAETKLWKICTVSASATVAWTPAPVLFAVSAKMQLFISLHRASFPKLRTVAQRLVEKVRLHGPDLPVDMDLLCAQLSWDIIGEPRFANYHGQLTAGVVTRISCSRHHT